ncbi:beta-galactosidase [Enterococcus timonensis]|uniref:beta-galactosidase n=1 Tax=Enterococcus timonensis TaxID=1852364 RepID=UPI0008DB19F9|nr:beta-galactosidase [Enterococcus timonensis]
MKILLAGDSTVADYQKKDWPMIGWGQVLREVIDEQFPKIEVLNFAKNGASTKSFIEEKLFEQLLEKIVPGDLVLLQFGHNDQTGSNAVPINDYYLFLQTMVEQIKDKQGQVILCTPVERRNFVNGNQIPTLREFTPVIRQLAQSAEVPYFDLNRYTNHLYQQEGEKKSSSLFAHWSKTESQRYPVGLMDNTHFAKAGAKAIASYVAIRIKEYLSQDPLFEKYYYGACMYPELWDLETIRKDVVQMKTLGMNFVRIGEFIWSSLEPVEGQYDFSLLQQAMDIFSENDIDVCLCIPTPTPPIWMTKNHPERLIKNTDGTVMVHGSRQHVCTNNEYFRKKAYQLTEKIGEFAQQYKNIVAIQLDNEFKCHVDLCFCDTCQKEWELWLQTEYREISNLNQAWGTKIWSEEYSDFSEVPMPLRTPFIHNSSLQNAFRKFTAETINDFAAGLCDYLRMHTAIPITHNTAFGFNLLNEELFSELDVVGFDTYPSADNYPAFLFNLDTFRNTRRNHTELLLLETSTSHTGHLENYVQPHPAGFLETEVFTGFAGGLKSFNFWHYRNHQFGVEQTHSTVVTTWGEPDLGFEEVKKSGALLEKMRPYLHESKLMPSSIAMIYSDTAKRFYNIETGGIYNHRALTSDFHASLIKAGISPELIPENADFSSYKVLLVPFVRYISPQVLIKLKQFVNNGGQLILGPMTGDRTKELTWPVKNGLDEIGEWLEISQVNQFVERFSSYEVSGQEKWLLNGLITTFKVDDTWKISLKTSDGKVTCAKKNIGAGSVTYLGGLPADFANDLTLKHYLQSEILPFEQSQDLLVLGENVVKYRRETSKTIQLYLANMTSSSSDFTLKKSAIDLLQQKTYTAESHEILPYSYLILSIDK